MKYLYQCTVKGCESVYSAASKALLHEKATGHTSFMIVEELATG